VKLQNSQAQFWQAGNTEDISRPFTKSQGYLSHIPEPTDALIELVEPAADELTVEQFLRGRGGLHHLS
jgi:hypothetical protein